MFIGIPLLYVYRYASIGSFCTNTSPLLNDGIDNDCDSRIDEEIVNGVDDDGDGLVDEDTVSSYSFSLPNFY